MFCLKCDILASNASDASDTVVFAFEVHPYWSLDFMIRLAMSYLYDEEFVLYNSCLSFSFTKLSDYEVQNDDTYVDLIYYSEEVYDALLRYPGQH